MKCTPTKESATDALKRAPNLGTVVTLEIEDLAFGGEGVGRHEDFVIFVPFVIPGETIEAEITEVKSRFGRARLRRVLSASSSRTTPPCPYFGACGGCQYQHLEYSEQLRWKHKQVADLFERLGGFDRNVVTPLTPCPAPYGYRNRIMVRSQWNGKKQGLDIGFLRYDNRLVVDLESCAIAEPELNDQLQNVRAHPPSKGGLKVSLRKAPPGWHVPPDSFFQNNFKLLPRLVDEVRDRLRASGLPYLVDTYCGVGFFALELADLVESYTGIELDRMAVRAARKNAHERSRLNGEFLEGDVPMLLEKVLDRFQAGRTSLIIDPPRRGCAPETIEHLRRMRPGQIIYVSCHPATLARDLKQLTADRVYDLVRLAPFDMFPQTQHVECVADLRVGSDA